MLQGSYLSCCGEEKVDWSNYADLQIEESPFQVKVESEGWSKPDAYNWCSIDKHYNTVSKAGEAIF